MTGDTIHDPDWRTLWNTSAVQALEQHQVYMCIYIYIYIYICIYTHIYIFTVTFT